MFRYFHVSFLLLISSLFLLWRKNTLILILFYLLIFALCFRHGLCTAGFKNLEKNLYSAIVGWSILVMSSVRFYWLMMLSSSISFLIFHPICSINLWQKRDEIFNCNHRFGNFSSSINFGSHISQLCWLVHMHFRLLCLLGRLVDYLHLM